MPPDFLSAAEKMADERIAPQRASAWPVLVLLVVLGFLYVAWYMEQFDEATQPTALTMATGAETGGPGL